MIPLLPPLYPDELLYSLLARYHWLTCSDSPKQTLDELFGNRHVRAGIALQSDLGALFARLPPRCRLTPEKLATEATLFPYLTAFQPQEVRDWALAMLIDGSAESVHVRLGLAAGAVRLPAALRYCPVCRVEMHALYGELYWRREHQLPGVLVCSVHGVPLADSLVRPAEANQHEFIVSDEGNCPPDLAPPTWAGNPEPMKLLRDIAQANANLLATSSPARPLAEWGEYYRAALVARGFGKGTVSIDQAAFLDAYLAYFNPILDVLPEAAPDLWLEGMARKHRKAFAPLRHVLLSLLLDALPLLICPQPFGPGPWLCRNPLAEHHGQPVITDCFTHEEGGRTIGVFRCSCGYAFSEAAEQGSRMRILDLGPLFEIRLRELLAARTGLRATARALAVDPNTVLRYVDKLGLSSGWKPRQKRRTLPAIDRDTVRTRWSAAYLASPHLPRKRLRATLPAEYAWLYRHDRDWLKAQPPFSAGSSSGRQRYDWPAIDAATAANLRHGAARLRVETPSVPVTRAALEHCLGKPHWLAKRLTKLPLCAAALEELTEPLETFQCRRVAWAVEELHRQALPIAVWRLRRLAGLRDRCAPSVEAALRAAENKAP